MNDTDTAIFLEHSVFEQDKSLKKAKSMSLRGSHWDRHSKTFKRTIFNGNDLTGLSSSNSTDIEGDYLSFESHQTPKKKEDISFFPVNDTDSAASLGRTYDLRFMERTLRPTMSTSHLLGKDLNMSLDGLTDTGSSVNDILSQVDKLSVTDSLAGLESRFEKFNPISSRQEYRASGLSRTQSMRSPPGFDHVKLSNDFAPFESMTSDFRRFESPLGKKMNNSRPKPKELKRFVTFAANLNADCDAEVPQAFNRKEEDNLSDEEDVVVSVVEDDPLFDLPDLGPTSFSNFTAKKKDDNPSSRPPALESVTATSPAAADVNPAINRINSVLSIKSAASVVSTSTSTSQSLSPSKGKIRNEKLNEKNKMKENLELKQPTSFEKNMQSFNHVQKSSFEKVEQRSHLNSSENNRSTFNPVFKNHQASFQANAFIDSTNKFVPATADNGQNFDRNQSFARNSVDFRGESRFQVPFYNQHNESPVFSRQNSLLSSHSHLDSGFQNSQFESHSDLQAQKLQESLEQQRLMNVMLQQQNAVQRNIIENMRESRIPPVRNSNRAHMRYSDPPNHMMPRNQYGSQGRPPVNSNFHGSPVTSQGEQNISNLLIRHKTTGYRPNIREILGHVVEFARDSHGSRLVQCLMEGASPAEKEMLINEVLPGALSLMQDLFGNYVMQNFIEHATMAQKKELCSQIENSMNILCFQPHGCRVVQRAIDVFESSSRNALLKKILLPKEKIIASAKDPHATHVLQKATTILQREVKNKSGYGNENWNITEDYLKVQQENEHLLNSIEEAVKSSILQLSVHPHACRLVQRALGDCDVSRSEHVKFMVETVRSVFPMLSVDQHGNFILQHLLDNGGIEQKAEVQAFVCSKFLELAQHKFGSHLVEKCFQKASPSQAVSLVTQLLIPARNRRSSRGIGGSPPNRDGAEDVLMSLMKDPYANFVVQRAFDASVGELRSELVQEIRDRADVLSRFTYGRHILSHVNRSS